MLEKHASELIAGRYESGALFCYAIGRRWDRGLVQHAFTTWMHVVEQRFLSDILNEHKEELVAREMQQWKHSLGIRAFQVCGRHIASRHQTIAFASWKSVCRSKYTQDLKLRASRLLSEKNMMFLKLMVKGGEAPFRFAPEWCFDNPPLEPPLRYVI